LARAGKTAWGAKANPKGKEGEEERVHGYGRRYLRGMPGGERKSKRMCGADIQFGVTEREETGVDGQGSLKTRGGKERKSKNGGKEGYGK